MGSHQTICCFSLYLDYLKTQGSYTYSANTSAAREQNAASLEIQARARRGRDSTCAVAGRNSLKIPNGLVKINVRRQPATAESVFCETNKKNFGQNKINKGR